MNATDWGAGLAEQRPGGGPPRDPQAEYADVRPRIHGLVDCLIDPGSTVVVVSKGDQELVRLGSSEGWHFPRTADGKYAGHHPADGAEAIAHLERLHEQGAEYFLLPSTYFWWLDHYDGLAEHLRSRYRLVADCPDACLIYDLRGGVAATRAPVATPSAETRTETRSSEGTNGGRVQNPLVPAIRALLDSLLPDREPVLVVSEGHDELLRLGRTALHFPDDGSGKHRSIGSIGEGAISAQLTAVRARGIRYLVVPDSAHREVEGSGTLREPLRERGREVAFREGICAIYELEPTGRSAPNAAERDMLRGRLRRLLRGGRGRSDG
jgi:hypothetical protein